MCEKKKKEFLQILSASFLGLAMTYFLSHTQVQMKTKQNKQTTKQTHSPDRDLIVALIGYGWSHPHYKHMTSIHPDLALETYSEEGKLEICRLWS